MKKSEKTQSRPCPQAEQNAGRTSPRKPYHTPSKPVRWGTIAEITRGVQGRGNDALEAGSIGDGITGD